MFVPSRPNQAQLCCGSQDFRNREISLLDNIPFCSGGDQDSWTARPERYPGYTQINVGGPAEELSRLE